MIGRRGVSYTPAYVPSVDTDVLVIGAGPAGGAAAIEASRAGCRVLVAEKAPHVGDAARSVGFVPLLFADGLPLPPILMQQRIRGTRIHLDDQVMERQWPGYTIPVRNLFRVLSGTAANLGAKFEAGFGLEKITPTAAASFSSPGGDLDIHAKVVIACDGCRSKAADLLGLERNRALHALQCEVLLLSEREWIDLHLHPNFRGGYAWLHPRRSTASCGVALVEGAHKSGLAIIEWLRQRLIAEGLIAPHFINQTTGTIPCSGLRTTLRIGQVIFAGDAAGTAHPMGTSGIWPAMESGCMAGRAAAGFVRGDGEALRAYERDLHRWLDPIHSRALDRRQFMEGAWGRIDFATLMREIVGETSR